MPETTDTLREVSDILGPQVAVLQMPGTGHRTWNSPDGRTFVRIDSDGEIAVGQVVQANGEPVGYTFGYLSPEVGMLVAAAIAEKAALLLLDRRT
ncbi:hypothetical protein GS462_11060 [Rhodococcus hoagii]|nr:hypothetical protein [Prescottella equi]MBM4650951.1 hypothetical protein [Prescottella equi]MBM4686702.1 hypothetical protein [Prescottella equi]